MSSVWPILAGHRNSAWQQLLPACNSPPPAPHEIDHTPPGFLSPTFFEQQFGLFYVPFQ